MTIEWIAADNPCPECGSTNQDVKLYATTVWRGCTVTCNECGEVVEYDEPEEPVEHRSASK